ncbi:telomere and ribosome associated protein Stm1, partial [Elaphomyces granulatus]
SLSHITGNDPDLDSDREPDPPTTAVEKPTPRHGKRDPPNEPPATTYGGSGGARGRGGRVTGNEEAFLDREAGSYNNRSRPVEEDQEFQRHGGRGHGDRGGRARNDRHSRTGHTDTNKQIEQGWGSNAGEGFLNDEQAAEAMADTEQIDSSAPPPETQPGGWGGETTTHEEKEPADKAKTYSEYLAELAEKRREDLGVKAARAPNEGTKPDKKWQSAKEFKRDEDEEQYIKGREDKARRERQRKEKQYLDVDMRFVEPSRGRGNGRGRGRGRGRGGGEGGRGEGGRGEGGRGEGDEPRGGGRSASGPTVTVDEENFPSLGAW